MFMLDIADGARSTGASGAAFRGRDHLAYQGLWAAEANAAAAKAAFDAAERRPADAAHLPDADFAPQKNTESNWRALPADWRCAGAHGAESTESIRGICGKCTVMHAGWVMGEQECRRR